MTAGLAATDRPPGNGSANVMRDNAIVGFGFVNVNVNLVVPPTTIVDGENAFVSVGGTTTTVREAVAALPVPPSVELTLPVVFVNDPVDVVVTSAVTVHDDDAGSQAHGW